MKTKICESCKLGLPLDQFYRSSVSSDGLYPRCKGCSKYYNSQTYRNQKARDKQPIIETTPLRVANLQFFHRNLCDIPGSFEPQLLNIKDNTNADLNLKLEISPSSNYYRSIFTSKDGELVRANDCMDLKSLLSVTCFYLADKAIYCSLKGVENE